MRGSLFGYRVAALDEVGIAVSVAERLPGCFGVRAAPASPAASPSQWPELHRDLLNLLEKLRPGDSRSRLLQLLLKLCQLFHQPLSLFPDRLG